MPTAFAQCARALLAAACLLVACDEPQRRVRATDRDADGLLTGRDIELALEACRPGCRLELLEGTYRDVAVAIGRDFPEGLVIEGAGAAKTHLRAAVPATGPVLWISGGPPGLAIRDLHVDGRKQEQPDSVPPEHGTGIKVTNASLLGTHWGRIERTEVSNFQKTGILVRDGEGWLIRDNLVHDIGCHTDIPCPMLREPVEDPYIEGRRRDGIGILLAGPGASGSVVVGNEVRDVTKVGIEVYSVNHVTDPDVEARARSCEALSGEQTTGFLIAENRVRGALSAGITVNHGSCGTVERNTVEGSGGRGVAGNGGTGISCGAWASKLLIADNQVVHNDGAGIRVSCGGGGIRLVRNFLYDNCRGGWEGFGDLHIGADSGHADGLDMEHNVVFGGQCSYALLLLHWRQVSLSGGLLMGGSRAGALLGNVEDAEVSDLSVATGSPAFFLVRQDVESLVVDSNVTATGASTLLVEDLRDADPGPANGAAP